MTQFKYKLMTQVKLMNICCPNIVLKLLYCFKTLFFSLTEEVKLMTQVKLMNILMT